MVFLIVFILGAVIILIAHNFKNESPKQSEQPKHIDLLDEDDNLIKKPKIKVTVSNGSDAPIQELKYFCIKDKGYNVSVWPKGHDQFDVLQFNIAGISYCEGVDKYLGEFVGILMAEPDNPYDPNAIKVLTGDGHHVGYVPKDITNEVRNETTLPSHCYCYIGVNDTTYFSCCYILRKE